MLHTVGLHREVGSQFAPNDRTDGANRHMIIRISNLTTVAWHGFLEKLLSCFTNQGSQSTSKWGKSYFVTRTKYSCWSTVLRYFEKVAECYLSIVMRYFYSITGQV